MWSGRQGMGFRVRDVSLNISLLAARSSVGKISVVQLLCSNTRTRLHKVCGED